jgi:hypothetical protein
MFSKGLDQLKKQATALAATAVAEVSSALKVRLETKTGSVTRADPTVEKCALRFHLHARDACGLDRGLRLTGYSMYP